MQKISDLYILTIWSVLHFRTQRSFDVSVVLFNVLNANHKSTEIEGKNVLGKHYIKFHQSGENIQNKWLLYKKIFMKRYPKYNQNQLTRTVVLEVLNAVALKY